MHEWQGEASLPTRGVAGHRRSRGPRLLACLLIAVAANMPFWGPSKADAQPRVTGVSVKDYGAAGNGSADDTSSLVTAFSATCASGGGTIYIPSGTYIINPAAASIPICSDLVVHGPGTLKVKPDAGNYRTIFASTPLRAELHK